jgi:hypothetical protein
LTNPKRHTFFFKVSQQLHRSRQRRAVHQELSEQLAVSGLEGINFSRGKISTDFAAYPARKQPSPRPQTADLHPSGSRT